MIRTISAEGSPAPDNKALIETARQAGVVGTVPDCVNGGKNNEMVEGLAGAAKITATPTVRINGEDYKYTTPDALVAKVNTDTVAKPSEYTRCAAGELLSPRVWAPLTVKRNPGGSRLASSG